MKIAIDLHIHTCLSPCANNDMTPNNIINMTLIKGLDAIAITDHNSIDNCKACIDVGIKKNIIVIPGIELQTKEEIHLICLFKKLDDLIKFYNLIKDRFPNSKNNTDIFGKQLILDENDNILEQDDRLLISSFDISVNEVFNRVHIMEGTVIPAHIDRNSYSIVSNLGFIPNELPVKTIELSKTCEKDEFLRNNKYLKKFNIITNSDAHRLEDILERENFIEVEAKNIDNIFKSLGGLNK